MPLYLNGSTAGLSFDCGYDLSQIVSIVENHVIPDSIIRLNIGEEELTAMLQNLLNSRGYSFQTSEEKKVVRDIKEKLCYVASNYDDEINKSKDTFKYKIPYGDEILISDELFKCTEIQLILICMLSGGSSSFKGLPERISKEVKNLVLDSMEVNVKVPLTLILLQVNWLKIRITVMANQFLK